jgi:hypothetical protein
MILISKHSKIKYEVAVGVYGNVLTIAMNLFFSYLSSLYSERVPPLCKSKAYLHGSRHFLKVIGKISYYWARDRTKYRGKVSSHMITNPYNDLRGKLLAAGCSEKKDFKS